MLLNAQPNFIHNTTVNSISFFAFGFFAVEFSPETYHLVNNGNRDIINILCNTMHTCVTTKLTLIKALVHHSQLQTGMKLMQ